MRYAITIICCYAHTLFAQQGFQTINMYTTQNGLSDNMILCIEQDSRGFLWIGTKEGLNRFDGNQFKKYFADKNYKAGLPNDNILDLCEYQYGKLLIATTNGLSVLNTLTGQFENEKIGAPILRAGSGAIINSLHKDKQAKIWVNHSGELDVLDSNLNYLYRFTDLDWARSLKGIFISLEEWPVDKQGRLWLPSDTSGINIVDFNAKKIFNADNNPQRLPFLQKRSVRSLALDENNDKLLYALWGEGLKMYDFKTGAERQELFGIKYKDEVRTINSIINIAPGKYLFYIGNNCFEISTTDFHSEPLTERSMPVKNKDEVNVSIIIFRSNNNQYWVGTTAGLALFDPQRSPYHELPVLEQTAKNEIAECTDMIIARSGTIYCTYNTNQLIVVPKDRKNFERYPFFGKDSSKLTEICEDKNGNLWIGTSKGIYQFDTHTKKIIPNTFLPPGSFSMNCNALYCDNDGDMWIATRYPFGLYRFIAATNKLEKINNAVTAYFETQGTSSRISMIAGGREGHVWMTSRLCGGIARYTKQNDEWKLYPTSQNNFNFIARKGVACMYVDERNYLWISNYAGDGLIRYDYRSDSILLFNRNDGLQSKYMRSINGDDAGNIWLTTEYGITTLNSTNFRVQSNISYSRLKGEEQEALFDPVSRSIILSERDKLVFVPASIASAKRTAPSPVIDKISINNEQQFIDPQSGPVQLNHRQNNIAIDFTTAYFPNADQMRFAYRLTGADNDWRYTDDSRTVQYASLAPGQYTFTIKASADNGEWGMAYSLFTFTIRPPYWQTWWFQALVFIAASAIIYFFVTKRIQFIRKEARLKHQIAETEMMALRAQMNPHFIFNCINSIDAMIQSNDKYHATMYLNKFAKLIRNILDSSKQNLVPLSKDIETLQLYVDLEMFRHRNKFKAEINADPQLLQEDYQVPPLIIQPYVENAILHGLRHRGDSNGKLIVNIRKQNGSLNYEITDNGVGRNKKQQQMPDVKKTNGYGMQICKDRIRIFNNEEEASVQVTDLINNNEPAGTKVTLQLKIQ